MMVLAPLHGERDRGRNAPSEEGSTIPTLISDMGIEKGKGIVRPSDQMGKTLVGSRKRKKLIRKQ